MTTKPPMTAADLAAELRRIAPDIAFQVWPMDPANDPEGPQHCRAVAVVNGRTRFSSQYEVRRPDAATRMLHHVADEFAAFLPSEHPARKQAGAAAEFLRSLVDWEAP